MVTLLYQIIGNTFPRQISPENASMHQVNVFCFCIHRNSVLSQPIDQFKIVLNPDYTPNLISLRMKDYYPRRRLTVFIIHGFLASIESEWMVEMARAYLTRVSSF